jgi:flavin reductase (DIM6/NTAB) family NADH-FMN oxidoreductase RutF
MVLSPQQLQSREAYALMTSLVIPRPIAWISSISPDGVVNVAPFSYFNGVTSRPPIIAVSIAPGRGGVKDTARNIRTGGEFVVNLVGEEQAEAMNRTATEYPYGVSEADEVGLELVPSETIRVPRLAVAPAALECRVERIVEVGEPPVAHILGEVLAFVLADGLSYEPLRGVEPSELALIGRLGQNRYVRLREIFALDRIPYRPSTPG